MIIHLIVGLIKKTLYKMSQYFPIPYKSFGGDINVKVDLSNYTTKTNFKNSTGVDASKLGLRSNLPNLTAGIEKADVDKLKTVPVDLSKQSNAVNNEVAKKNTKITERESKIPSISGLATNAALTAVEDKIPDISSLVKKADYDAKISDTENECITTVDYNKFTKNMVDNNIRSKNLVDKSAIHIKSS